MPGIHEFKIANCFVAKPANISDIHDVSRLGSCCRHCSTDSIHGVIALNCFNSHGYSARTYSEVSKVKPPFASTRKNVKFPDNFPTIDKVKPV